MPSLPCWQYCAAFLEGPGADLLGSKFLRRIAVFRYVAWGNAKRALGGPECQHGPAECRLNRLINCAAELRPEQTAWFPFVRCLADSVGIRSVEGEVGSCAAGAGIDADALRACAEGPAGAALEAAAEKETAKLDPPHQGVPWVTGQSRRYVGRSDGASWAALPPRGPAPVSPSNSLPSAVAVNGITIGDDTDLLWRYICIAYTGPRPKTCFRPPPEDSNGHHSGRHGGRFELSAGLVGGVAGVVALAGVLAWGAARSADALRRRRQQGSDAEASLLPTPLGTALIVALLLGGFVVSFACVALADGVVLTACETGALPLVPTDAAAAARAPRASVLRLRPHRVRAEKYWRGPRTTWLTEAPSTNFWHELKRRLAAVPRFQWGGAVGCASVALAVWRCVAPLPATACAALALAACVLPDAADAVAGALWLPAALAAQLWLFEVEPSDLAKIFVLGAAEELRYRAVGRWRPGAKFTVPGAPARPARASSQLHFRPPWYVGVPGVPGKPFSVDVVSPDGRRCGAVVEERCSYVVRDLESGAPRRSCPAACAPALSSGDVESNPGPFGRAASAPVVDERPAPGAAAVLPARDCTLGPTNVPPAGASLAPAPRPWDGKVIDLAGDKGDMPRVALGPRAHGVDARAPPAPAGNWLARMRLARSGDVEPNPGPFGPSDLRGTQESAALPDEEDVPHLQLVDYPDSDDDCGSDDDDDRAANSRSCSPVVGCDPRVGGAAPPAWAPSLPLPPIARQPSLGTIDLTASQGAVASGSCGVPSTVVLSSIGTDSERRSVLADFYGPNDLQGDGYISEVGCDACAHELVRLQLGGMSATAAPARQQRPSCGETAWADAVASIRTDRDPAIQHEILMSIITNPARGTRFRDTDGLRAAWTRYASFVNAKWPKGPSDLLTQCMRNNDRHLTGDAMHCYKERALGATCTGERAAERVSIRG
eukprot:scaffold19.g1804.t1